MSEAPSIVLFWMLKMLFLLDSLVVWLEPMFGTDSSMATFEAPVYGSRWAPMTAGGCERLYPADGARSVELLLVRVNGPGPLEPDPSITRREPDPEPDLLPPLRLRV